MKFCTDTTCNANCKTISGLNGQCFTTGFLQPSNFAAQSFSFTCGTPQQQQPAVQQQQPATGGAQPSILPATSSTNGAETFVVSAGALIGTAALAFTTLL